MSVSTFGDLAQSYVIRRANARLGREMQTLSTELTTGLKSDRRSAVSGDTGMIGGIERSLGRVAALSSAAREANLHAGGVQSILERVQGEVNRIKPDLLNSGILGGAASPNLMAENAEAGFKSVVSAINTAIGGRYSLSGTATGTPPLRDGDAILADLETLVGGAPDADTMIARIDAYFAPTGAFMTNDYQGNDGTLAPQEVADGMTVTMELRADDSTIRDTLAGLAKARFANAGAFGTKGVEYEAVLQNAGAQMLRSSDELTDHRAVIGANEGRIELAETRNANEETALQKARADLIGIDPFETASRLRETELQLETLYAMTARLSRLSLTNYLR
ncbi:flagellin [Palleronia sp. LCG004]|uniref:flagellin n=1 Tax=Palleronia sp. LCG004 TaxID=3079304 RepID=UPI00294299A6|nr:flagellin [Palleronia sp. LCG004]WOI56330.1 flagellin [Palleronia sp. LCG004]